MKFIKSLISILSVLCLIMIVSNCSSDDDTNNIINPLPKVFEGDVVLSSQEEVDAFGLEGYNIIAGDLFLGVVDPMSPDQTTNINSLTTLNTITSIEGDFTIYNNPLLPNLQGLNNLTFLNSGGLEITSNDILTSINSLSRLASLKFLVVEENPMLLNLDGLSGIRSARESVIIVDNTALVNINGLINITFIDGELLFISGNMALSSINGLSGLESVLGTIAISNTQITNLNALEGLMEVGNGLFISYNETLTNFCGLLPLIDNNGLTGILSTKGNGYNPTLDQLNIDECSL